MSPRTAAGNSRYVTLCTWCQQLVGVVDRGGVTKYRWRITRHSTQTYSYKPRGQVPICGGGGTSVEPEVVLPRSQAVTAL